MKEYTIAKKTYSENVWSEVETLNVDTYKWLDNGYEPRVQAQICYDSENIYIKYSVWETQVTAKYKNMHEDVYKDSCVEFFFRPASSPNFFNFETNCIGTLLLGYGPKRDGREVVKADMAIFEMKPSIKNPDEYSGDMWTLEYKIPFSFLKKYWGEFPLSEGLYANCYKCGDETAAEHYGMWSPVELPSPDFHRPEFFGRMYFEI